jgi:hypothetical protein
VQAINTENTVNMVDAYCQNVFGLRDTENDALATGPAELAPQLRAGGRFGICASSQKKVRTRLDPPPPQVFLPRFCAFLSRFFF